MNIDSQILVLEQEPHSPSKYSGLLAVYTTLISRTADIRPSRYVGTRVSSRLHYLLSPTKAG
jgi:hypothetical protein